MKIKAITQDQIVLVDGLAEFPPHCSFSMPGGEWAVFFDTEIGVGEVEFLDNRPNENIDASAYAARYQFLETVHADAKAAREAEAEALAAEQAASDEPTGTTE